MPMVDADELKKSYRERFYACLKWEAEAKDEITQARAISAAMAFLECILRINEQIKGSENNETD